MDPIEGQQALFEVEQSLSPAFHAGKVPRYKDIALSPTEIEEAREEWPEATEKQQVSRMKMRKLMRLQHEIVVDPATGRRYVGGPQPQTKAAQRRVDAALIEAADERIDEIRNAMFAPLSPKNPDMDRHRAAVNIVRETREARKHEMAEDELDGASDAEVRDLAMGIIREMFQGGDLDLAQIIDADVVELPSD